MSDTMLNPPTVDPLSEPIEQMRRVMIVTSDPDRLQAIRAVFTDAGYQVLHGTSGAEIRELVDFESPDVVVIDASDGRTDPLRCLPFLRSSQFSPAVPVILIRPAPESVHTAQVVPDGVDEVVSAPWDAGRLLLRIRSMLHVRHLRQQLRDIRSLRGEQARMWNVLLDFSRLVAEIEDLDPLLDRIVNTAAQMTCSRRVSLMLPDANKETLTIAKAIGFNEELASRVRVPIGRSIAGQAFETGEAVTSIDAEPDAATGAPYRGESFVSMPIVSTHLHATHQRVGVLNITHRYCDRPFTAWELEFIDLLGSLAGSAIDDILSRRTRESLLRLERDLQVAAKIQRRTFPSTLPKIRGFQIAASSQPAAETGGDTYDVIGYQQGPPGHPISLVDVQADRVILLLADATGHGIGPALSVSQVRAMLRMAVRMQPDLALIANHMNEQLYADLPSGRFITAWLGELDARAGTLTSYSAGQAPLLHYHAATGTVTEMAADTRPLGILPDLDPVVGPPIVLHPGDCFAVISDGYIETPQRHFGVERVASLLQTHHDASADEILIALRNAVTEFTGGADATDDQTAVIVRRG